MSNVPFESPHSLDDELLEDYHFDYKKAKPNRFAHRYDKQALVVVLDEDVAQVFTTPESVNKVLRALIQSMPSVKGVNQSPSPQALGDHSSSEHA